MNGCWLPSVSPSPSAVGSSRRPPVYRHPDSDSSETPNTVTGRRRVCAIRFPLSSYFSHALVAT